MNKMVAAFAVCFVLLSMLSAVMDGSASMVATDLTAGIDDAVAILPVTTTNGFQDAGGIVMVGNEKIEYTGVTAVTFTGCDRGIEGTEAEAHATGVMVYNEDLGVINYALGFNFVRVANNAGWTALFDIPWKFVTITAPKLLLWDFSFFTGELVLVRYILMTLSIGFYIAFALQALQVAMGALRIG